MPTDDELQQVAHRLRLHALKMVAPHGFGYLGQVLSAAELFAVVYGEHLRPGQDKIVISPGHYVIGAYAGAVEKGLITEAEAATYGDNDSALEAIGTERSPWIDLTCGSMSQGLSGAAGFAMAARLKGHEDATRVFTMISDGELEEGQIWEAAIYIAHHRLRNVIVFLDANDSQVDGPVSMVTTLEPLADKWRSFGWDAYDIDGHDIPAIRAAFDAALASDAPSVIIGRTSMRQGLDCLPESADTHFIKLPPELTLAATRELEARLA
ncbi:MAG: transketolase [Leucobacter sp.]|nr:transketolase [Leucobacter sp.]